MVKSKRNISLLGDNPQSERLRERLLPIFEKEEEEKRENFLKEGRNRKLNLSGRKKDDILNTGLEEPASRNPLVERGEFKSEDETDGYFQQGTLANLLRTDNQKKEEEVDDGDDSTNNPQVSLSGKLYPYRRQEAKDFTDTLMEMGHPYQRQDATDHTDTIRRMNYPAYDFIKNLFS